jgi:hypothetical protein
MINILTVTVTSSHSETFSATAGTGVTTISNTQVIDINSPRTSTTYTVTVRCTQLTSSAIQPYALVVTGETTYLNATSSTIDDNTSTEKEATPLRFSSSGYLIVLSVLVFLLIVGYVHFYRLSKAGIGNNAANYRNDFEDVDYQFLEDEAGGAGGLYGGLGQGGAGTKPQQLTLFQRLFTRQPSPNRKPPTAGGSGSKKQASSKKTTKSSPNRI